MIPAMSRLLTAVACALAGAAPSTASAAPDSGSRADSTRSPEELVLPAAMQDIDGREVDLAGLARRRQVVFVTMKGPWCGVCKRQLVRLRRIQSRLSRVRGRVRRPGPRAAEGDLRGPAPHRVRGPLRRGRRSEARPRPRPAARRGPDPAGHLQDRQATSGHLDAGGPLRPLLRRPRPAAATRLRKGRYRHASRARHRRIARPGSGPTLPAGGGQGGLPTTGGFPFAFRRFPSSQVFGGTPDHSPDFQTQPRPPDLLS